MSRLSNFKKIKPHGAQMLAALFYKASLNPEQMENMLQREYSIVRIQALNQALGIVAEYGDRADSEELVLRISKLKEQ